MRHKTGKLMQERSLKEKDYMDANFDSSEDVGLMDRIDTDTNLDDS